MLKFFYSCIIVINSWKPVFLLLSSIQTTGWKFKNPVRFFIVVWFFEPGFGGAHMLIIEGKNFIIQEKKNKKDAYPKRRRNSKRRWLILQHCLIEVRIRNKNWPVKWRVSWLLWAIWMQMKQGSEIIWLLDGNYMFCFLFILFLVSFLFLPSLFITMFYDVWMDSSTGGLVRGNHLKDQKVTSNTRNKTCMKYLIHYIKLHHFSRS